MGIRIDLTDKRFGRLVVKEFVGANKWGQSVWKCLCDCGNEKNVLGNALTRPGRPTRSCGCINNERVGNLNRGKHLSKSAKLKLSEFNKGKKLSKETCRRMSESRMGDKHPRWNSNLTDEDRQPGRSIPGYKVWHAAVLKRDNYTCQICGKRGGKLITHHLESYNCNPKLRTKLSNGTTVCEKHHKDFHHIFGYGNNTKKQFIQFKEEQNVKKTTDK